MEGNNELIHNKFIKAIDVFVVKTTKHPVGKIEDNA